MTAPAVDPLANLRDYRVPDSVGWWPLAVGWWVLGILSALLVAAVGWWLWRRYRRRAAARLALAQIADLRDTLVREADPRAFASGVSQLLRRFALARFDRVDVASLTGDAWLEFLDANGGGGAFTSGSGRALLEAPYRRSVEFDAPQLADLATSWIRYNVEARR